MVDHRPWAPSYSFTWDNFRKIVVLYNNTFRDDGGFGEENGRVELSNLSHDFIQDKILQFFSDVLDRSLSI